MPGSARKRNTSGKNSVLSSAQRYKGFKGFSSKFSGFSILECLEVFRIGISTFLPAPFSRWPPTKRLVKLLTKHAARLPLLLKLLTKSATKLPKRLRINLPSKLLANLATKIPAELPTEVPGKEILKSKLVKDPCDLCSHISKN